MLVRLDALALFTAEDANHVIDAEAFLHAGHARENFLGDDERIGNELIVAQTHVAGGAILGFQILAEILHERLMPACGPAGVAVHILDVAIGIGEEVRRTTFASVADFCMIRFQVITSPPEYSKTHSASSPSRPARPVSC